eukprot:7578146-Ditylum_brightwellii.AAC.1
MHSYVGLPGSLGMTRCGMLTVMVSPDAINNGVSRLTRSGVQDPALVNGSHGSVSRLTQSDSVGHESIGVESQVTQHT